MFPNWLNILLCYFDFWGLPTEFHVEPTYRKVIRLASIVHFVLGLIVTVMLIFYLQRPVNDPLGTLNDVIKHGGTLIVFWSTLIELNTKHSIRRNFWQHFNQIDSRFCSHRHFSLPDYLNKARFCFTTYAVVCLLYLQQIVSNTGAQYLYFWFTHFTLITMYLNRVFYYLFCLELIKYELGIIENETKEVARVYRNKSYLVANGKSLLFMEFEHKRFKWIREYFQSIYDMCKAFNHFLGWSNVITILFSFQLIITDVIWLYWKLFNKQHISPLC